MASLTIGGTRLRVHPLFLLLLFVLAWAERFVEGMTVFGIVLLHEMGHAAAARGCGVHVKEVELLPFGGVARMEGLIETDPSVETVIAVAGPLTNLFLLGIGFALSALQWAPPAWLQLFAAANLTVVGVNMLPALPLDGGRLYRAYRSRRIGYRRATLEALSLSRALASVMFIGGIAGVYFGVSNVSLPVLALFVFAAAAKERHTTAYAFMTYLARKQSRLESFGCMEAAPLAARRDATVKEVADLFAADKFHVVWVLDEAGRPTGIVTEADVLDALFDGGPDTRIAVVRQTAFIDRK